MLFITEFTPPSQLMSLNNKRHLHKAIPPPPAPSLSVSLSLSITEAREFFFRLNIIAIIARNRNFCHSCCIPGTNSCRTEAFGVRMVYK